MASSVKNHDVQESAAAGPQPAPKRATRVFIPLVSPYLYGMERAVIELFDALRPEVEPYFLQSKRIFERRLPIIEEMTRRGFSIELLPDRTDWERLAKPRSLNHLVRMITAIVRSNLATLRGVRGKDVLYVPGISAAASSLLAAAYCRLSGRRVIHHFHDLGTGNALFPLWIPLVTDFVHNTQFGFQKVKNGVPAIRNKQNFIVPSITEVDERLPDDPDLCREFLQWRNLFFVGQISPHKGVDLLLEAFATLAAKYPDVKLHLVGEGKHEFREELDKKVQGAALGARVKFWGFREDVTRLLHFAYIYVQTSPPSRVQESFGRSVVEAMARGVPIVCFRSGALQEIVVDGKTGLLCDEGVRECVEAVEILLRDAEYRDTCGHYARQRYEKLFSQNAVLGRWEEFFERGSSSLRAMPV